MNSIFIIIVINLNTPSEEDEYWHNHFMKNLEEDE